VLGGFKDLKATGLKQVEQACTSTL